MDLEECVLITDTALSYLAAGCPRLEKLVDLFRMISFCSLLTFFFLAVVFFGLETEFVTLRVDHR